MKKIQHNIYKIILPIIGVICSIVVVLVMYDRIRLYAVRFSTGIQSPPSTWVTLSNSELGITLSVPPQIVAYEDKDNPNGCRMSLILGGVDASTSVFLMPEFTDCTRKNSLRNFYSYEGSFLSKRITVLPARNSSEVQGIVLSHVMANGLATVPYYSNAGCVRDSLKIIISDIRSGYKDGAIPVIIQTRPECPINPHAIIAQYYPEFKKVILVESMYGFAENGDFYVEHTDTSKKTVDLDIYRSIKVFR
jgi:hypothetical protein